MAVKWSIPNMPRLEIVKVPPCKKTLGMYCRRLVNYDTWYSDGCNLPSRAFLAKAFVSAEIAAKPFEPASFNMGVIRPVGVATATDISAFLYLIKAGSELWFLLKKKNTYVLMTSPSQAEFASGTSARAQAVAFTTKSFTLSFVSFSDRELLKTSRSLRTLSILISTVR